MGDSFAARQSILKARRFINLIEAAVLYRTSDVDEAIATACAASRDQLNEAYRLLDGGK